jgi:ABC-type sugar transport system substrate-binding protein
LWLARAIHYKGIIFQDLGLAGVPLAATIIQGEDSVFNKYPAIKLVTFYGQFATGPTVQAIASLLTAHPDVAGVDSMAFVSGAFTAFANAHHAIVPTAGQTYNGTVQDCVTVKGADCGLTAWPAYQTAYVLRTVLDVLQGKKEPHTQTIPTTCYTTDGGGMGSLACAKLTTSFYQGGNSEGTTPVSPPWVSPPLTPAQVNAG